MVNMLKFEEKPYNMCLNCVYIGKQCDGPNFLAMSVERWCEWCKLRKEYLGWTNAQVAEIAEVSKVSVERVMRGEVKDIRISTMQGITKALVNGTWGQYPCAMAVAETSEDDAEWIRKAEKSEKECRRLQSEIDLVRRDAEQKVDILTKQLDESKKLMRERYDFLKRKDKVILILSVLLALAMITIIAGLIFDAMNPDKGFFWLDSLLRPYMGKINT